MQTIINNLAFCSFNSTIVEREPRFHFSSFVTVPQTYSVQQRLCTRETNKQFVAVCAAPSVGNFDFLGVLNDNMSSGEKMKIKLAKVREEFKMSESDCGSSRVQVAQLTTKIKHLSSVVHKKDKQSRRGLIAMVQRRKKLFKYMRRTDWDSYCLSLSKLGLGDNPNYNFFPDVDKDESVLITTVGTVNNNEIKVHVQVSGEKTQTVFNHVFEKMVAAAQPVPGFPRVKGGKTPDEDLKVGKELTVVQSYEDLEDAFEPGESFSFDAIIKLQEVS